MRWGSEDMQLLGTVIYCAVEALKVLRHALPVCRPVVGPVLGRLDFQRWSVCVGLLILSLLRFTAQAGRHREGPGGAAKEDCGIPGAPPLWS